jgi:GPH family glycoside/pentoside/hexuronide:cation symporter
MLSGTAAAVVVALGTVPAGRWLIGGQADARSFFAAALLFAAASVAILLLVGRFYRDGAGAGTARPVEWRAALLSLWRNRAFVRLIAAMLAMIVAVTVLSKSVLYLFKYLAGDASAGQLALAAMALVSAIAIPLYMVAARLVGLQRLWLAAAGAGMILLLLFGLLEISQPEPMQIFLVAMQAMIVGLNFVFWAMLPNTIEYGERETGTHVEAAVFGMAALLQRIGIGIATAILGWSFDAVGYVANVPQSEATLAGMRAVVVVVPVVFLALSCVAMATSPIGRRERESRPA